VLGLPEWAERDPFEWPLMRTGASTRRYNGSLDCGPLKKLESMGRILLGVKGAGCAIL
jgi:hypothetical protein